MLNLRIWVWKAWNVLWEGDHIRLVLTKDSKGVSNELGKQVSAILRKIGCRCVIDEQVRKICKYICTCTLFELLIHVVMIM